MLTILMVIPNRSDATSWYRGMGPLAALRKKTEVNLVFTSGVDWSILKIVDLVFMQRPYLPEHLQIAEMCRDVGRPLWSDYDDLLFDVPTDNPAHGSYMTAQTKQNIVDITRLSTFVTVSTAGIKRVLQLPGAVLNEKVFVVPNALDDDLLQHERPFATKQIFAWRGSPTHARDCFAYAQPMVEFAKRNPQAGFRFIGQNPWMVTDCMDKDQAMVLPPVPVEKYFLTMALLNPLAVMVPLDDSLFNRCKSNIAWIEATLAGGVALAPEWEEWQRPGVLTYRDEKTFGQQLDFIVNNPDFVQSCHQRSREFIRENLMLSKVNELRLQLAEAAAYGRKYPDGGSPVTDETMVLE